MNLRAFLAFSWLFVLILPAIFIFYLIYYYTVNMPAWDEWLIGATIVKSFQGELTFSDLIAQHNESRYFFPRLIYIGFAYLTHWNIRAVTLSNAVVSCVISLALLYVTRKTIVGSTLNWLVPFFLSNLLIFSTIQFESWHSGLMLPNYISVACIAICLAIVYSPLKATQKLICGSLLSTISTFSFANGLLCWVVFLVAFILVHTFKDWREKSLVILGVILGFIANLSIYFIGYVKPSSHPSFFIALSQPGQAIKYFLIFIGTPLGFGDLKASLLVGLSLILLSTVVFIYTVLHWGYPKFRYQVTAWLALGSYAYLTSLITTAGRLGFGVEHALYTSRYTTHSIYLPIALINLVAITSISIGERLQRYKLVIGKIFLFFLVGLFLNLYFSTSAYGYHQMILTSQDKLRNKSCLQWINQVLEEDCLKKNVYPELNFLIQTANQLDRLDLLHPKLVKTKRLQDIQGKIPPNNTNDLEFGYFESLEKTANDEWLARGWAILPMQQSIAHAVILAYEQSNGDAIAFAISELRDNRDDVSLSLHNTAYQRSGWQKTFSSERLPQNSLKISAWAFDANSGKAFKLKNQHLLTQP